VAAFRQAASLPNPLYGRSVQHTLARAERYRHMKTRLRRTSAPPEPDGVRAADSVSAGREYAAHGTIITGGRRNAKKFAKIQPSSRRFRKFGPAGFAPPS
jgi:hypothetical protein